MVRSINIVSAPVSKVYSTDEKQIYRQSTDTQKVDSTTAGVVAP